MAVWTEPKTDWKIQPVDALGLYNGDYCRVSDYNRIKGNLEYLAERISAIFNVVTLQSMPDTNVSTLYIHDRFNPIERNIDILKTSLPRAVSLPSTKTWVENNTAPTFSDLNRIESCCLTLYHALNSQTASAIMWRLPFHMNGGRF